MTQKTIEQLPHWDMTTVYPGLDSPEFNADFEQLAEMITRLDAYLAGTVKQASPDAPAGELAQMAGELVSRFNDALRLSGTLRAYLTGFTAVDSFNTDARRLESRFQVQAAKLDELMTRFRSWAGKVAGRLPEIFKLNETARAHSFALQEAAERSRYQMSPVEEALSSELSLSGARAWGKLQGNVTSQLTVDFEMDGQVRKMSMPALINLRSHSDEDVRRRAYEAELIAWASVREPLAAAMNGIKGETITLNNHRGRPDPLHSALEMSRIDRETLDAMLGAMVDSVPYVPFLFQSQSKAHGQGKAGVVGSVCTRGQSGTPVQLG